jgi:hypothetical protein
LVSDNIDLTDRERVVRRIVGPKRNETVEASRKLHNEELHNVHSSPSAIRMSKSRIMRWVGHVARKREKRNAHRILVGNPEGKRPLGRSKRRWEDNIEMDLRGIGWCGMYLINLFQDKDHGGLL